VLNCEARAPGTQPPSRTSRQPSVPYAGSLLNFRAKCQRLIPGISRGNGGDDAAISECDRAYARRVWRVPGDNLGVKRARATVTSAARDADNRADLFVTAMSSGSNGARVDDQAVLVRAGDGEFGSTSRW
jgi:hypothetical protein